MALARGVVQRNGLDSTQQAGSLYLSPSMYKAKQVQSENLNRLFKQILQETGITPDLICLEITEQFLLHDTERKLDMVAELKALGSFTANVINNPEDAAIVKSIIAMARSLNLQVVAGGVENEAQLRFVQQEGCDRAQGFDYAAP